MADKKDKSRFTIQFSETDPSHIQVIDILNRQGRRSKAPYIVSAVLHYEKFAITPVCQPAQPVTDVRMIEAFVRRLFAEMESVIIKKTERSVKKKEAPMPEELCSVNSLEAFGQDSLDAIGGALDAFRAK